MRQLILFFLLLASPAFGVDHYIDDAGTDAGDCTNSGSPCKTWAYALASTRMPAGDRLVVKNGTYSSAAGTGYPNINCSSGYNNGTAANPITVIAENERQAFLDSTGAVRPTMRVQNCSYWTVEGLYLDNDDLAPLSQDTTPILYVLNSSNITMRRLLLNKGNRYANHHQIEIDGGANNLAEENEFYSFHRHGLLFRNTPGSVARRNYFNSRDRADIGGGYPSNFSAEGDNCTIDYPASNTLWENNICENSGVGFEVISVDGIFSNNNRFYGNISYQTQQSWFSNENYNLGSSNSDIRNHLDVNGTSSSTGGPIRNQAGPGTTINGLTVIGAAGKGVNGTALVGSTLALSNALVLTSANTGIEMSTSQTSWSVNYGNSFGNGGSGNYSPSSHANITNSTAVDAVLGSCKAWIPLTSPMKGAGLAGVDKGANILYQYVNGVLTSTPLWNTSDNNFTGCGVTVAGINDTAGNSCTNVDIRLSIGTANGCAFPAGYGEASGGGGPWVATDNLDSYSAGASIGTLNGGSSWAAAWVLGAGTATVEDAPAGGQGGKALRLQAGSITVSRAVTGLSAGISSFKFYINTTAPAGPIDVSLDVAGSARCLVEIATDGNFKIYDGTTFFGITTYSANAWHKADIEFDDTNQPDKCRARLNDGIWSSWFNTVNGAYTNLDGFRIVTGSGFASTAYIDDIKEGTASVIISTISVSSVTGRWFVGEVKPLTWSSTDLTGNVDILGSWDNGASYQMIAPGIANSGSYNWTASGPASTTFRPRVRSSNSPGVFDDSDSDIVILGTYLKIR